MGNFYYIISVRLKKLLLLLLLSVVTKTAICAYPAGYVPCLPGSGGDLATADPPGLTITVDVNDQAQTIHSFGASDAWSIQFVGQWPITKREAIADLLFETGIDGSFDPIGIGLSGWRFNLGAGSSRQNNIYDQWRRADTFLSTDYLTYDWSRLPGQRWFLQAAKARGTDYFTAFVNSPPINMTKNGNAFCDASSGDTNLMSSKYDDFAVYLATIMEHFSVTEGINFDHISPINEPEWAWEGGQEGCRYYQTSDMADVVDELDAELAARSLSTKIEIPEAGVITDLYGSGGYDYIDSFFDLASGDYVGDKVTTIAGHSYWTATQAEIVSNRTSLRNKLDSYPAAEYSMTEYCILEENGNGRDLGIDPALYLARVVHFDLTIARASSWYWWLGVSPYDYKDGLVYVDYNKTDGNYYESKMLWAMGNYSRFIRPGMKRIEIQRSDGATDENTVDDLMVSSYYDEPSGVVVTVFVNYHAHNAKLVQLNYQNIPANKVIDSIVPYVTSSTGNLTAYGELSPGETIRIPKKSIVTLVAMHDSSNDLVGDFEPDGDVDTDDLLVLLSQWLQPLSDPSADIAPDPRDGTVNFKDFAAFAENYLK